MYSLVQFIDALVRPPKETPDSVNNEYIPLLKTMDLFKGLDDNEFRMIENLIYEEKFESGEVIITEGDESDAVYFLVEGEVNVLKIHPDKLTQHQINTIQAGDYFGEMAFIKDSKRTATVQAKTPVKLLVLETKLFNQAIANSVAHKKIMHCLNNKLYERIKGVNEFSVKSLERELEQSEIRNNMGRFLICVITLLCVYAFCMKVTSVLLAKIPDSTLITTGLLTIFLIIAIMTIKLMPYPLSFYGVTTKNWRKAVFEGIVFSIPILLFVLGLKFILDTYSVTFHGSHLFYLFHTVGSPHGWTTKEHIYFWVAMAFVYSAHSIVQEFATRGVLQSAMQKFFINDPHQLLAIIFSNVIFSTMHVFLSIEFALFTFIPGLFWGWMYGRHKTLIGSSISHILIGLWVLFIVGF